MAVYIDDMKRRYRNMVMSHMMADTLDELHAMADLLGLKREWFQEAKPGGWSHHYDISESKALEALKLGATRCTQRDLVLRFSPKFQAAKTPAQDPDDPGVADQKLWQQGHNEGNTKALFGILNAHAEEKWEEPDWEQVKSRVLRLAKPLAEAAVRHRAATPGPWKAVKSDRVRRSPEGGPSYAAIEAVMGGFKLVPVLQFMRGDAGVAIRVTEADLEFVTHAWVDLEAAFNEIARLQRQLIDLHSGVIKFPQVSPAPAPSAGPILYTCRDCGKEVDRDNWDPDNGLCWGCF